MSDMTESEKISERIKKILPFGHIDFLQRRRTKFVVSRIKRDTPSLFGDLTILDNFVYNAYLSYAYLSNFNNEAFKSIVEGKVKLELIGNNRFNRYSEDEISASVDRVCPLFVNFPPKMEDLTNE